MNVFKISQNISFKAIELKPPEKEKSDKILGKMKLSSSESNDLSYKLFNIFDKQIQKEASQKSGKVFYQEDFLQKMYLTFFETIQDVKELTTEKLIEILNMVKPDRNEVKESYRLGTKSLSDNISNEIKKPLEIVLSENNLPVYLREATKEERANAFKKIKSITENAGLTSKEESAIKEIAQGKTYVKMAKERGISYTRIRQLESSSIAKIQFNQNALPEEFENFIISIKKALDIPQSIDETKAIFIKYPHLLNYPIKQIYFNIFEASKALGIDMKIYTQAALKQPSLFYLKPKNIVKKIEKISNALDIDRRTYIQKGLKDPSFFFRNPETIRKNVRIIEYYKLLQNKKRKKNVFYPKPDSVLFVTILNFLVKKNDGLKKAIAKKDFVNYIIKSNKTYEFEIPQHEVAEDFIKFVKDFSLKNFKKEIFKIKVLNV